MPMMIDLGGAQGAIRQGIPNVLKFPLRPSANGRYLETFGGEPLVLAWRRWDRLYQEFTLEESRAIMLAYPHINGVAVRAVESTPEGDDPSNTNDDMPFLDTIEGGPWVHNTTHWDLTQPNDDYWDHFVEFVQMCASIGRIVMVRACLYSGHDASLNGFFEDLTENSDADCESFGAYLGAKLAGCPNLIWNYFGDSAHATVQSRMAAHRDGLATTDRADRLYTVHLYSGSTSNNTDDGGITGWTGDEGPAGGGTGLISIYTLRDREGSIPKPFNPHPADHALDVYADNAGDPFPMFDTEPQGEGNTEDSQLGADFRTVIYELYLSGVWCGYLHRLEGGFADEDTDDSEGLRDLERAMQLFRSVAWHTLEPSTSGLVTAGGGTAGSANYVARAFDGSTLAILRTRNGASFTVDLSLFSGTITARWYDPTDGTFTAATGSPLANSGTHAFVASTEVGNNSDGAADWVLLLEAA